MSLIASRPAMRRPISQARPTHAGSSERRDGDRCGAPAFLSIFSPAPARYLRAARLIFFFSLRPHPGPLVTISLGAARLVARNGSGGAVPEFHGPPRGGTALGTDKRLKSRENCARFQSSSYAASRVRRAQAWTSARITRLVHGTVELWNSSVISQGYQLVSGSRAVPSGAGRWNRHASPSRLVRCRRQLLAGRNILWGGYAVGDAGRADLHLVAADAPKNFRDPQRERAGAGLELGRSACLAGRIRYEGRNGGKLPFSAAPLGVVGMDASECLAQVPDLTAFPPVCRQLGNQAEARQEGAGIDRQTPPPGPPIARAPARCMLAHEIFGRSGRPSSPVRMSQGRSRAKVWGRRKGSGVCRLPRLSPARAVAPGQAAGRVGVQESSGSLRISNGLARLGREASHVKA